jgi:protein TonB
MIKHRNTNMKTAIRGLRYYYALVSSLVFHLIIFALFFAVTFHKSDPAFKTYYIELTNMGKQSAQSPPPAKIVNIPKPAEPIRTEPPLINEPVMKPESVISPEIPKSIESVSVIQSAPEPVAFLPAPVQSSGNTGNIVSYSVPSGSASAVDMEFGARGAPTYLKKPMPAYPLMAKKLGKEGKVVLRLSINEKGRLMNVEVIEPAGYGFTESAVEAVRTSTFSPAYENGTGIASKALVTIRFTLK